MLIPIIAILALLPLASPQCLSNYQYADPNTGSCLPCPYNCKSCFNQLFCMQCTPQHYLSNAQCLPCSFGCSVCQDPSTCTTCNDGLYLTASGGCSPCATGVATCSIATIQTCTSGYFLLGSICAGCLSNCKTCSDFVTCSACMLGYYLEPTGTSCSPCPSNCRVCSGSTSCSECQQGYTQNATGCTAYSCQSIDPFCASCASGSCLSCEGGKYLSGGSCKQGGSLLCLQSTGPSFTECSTSGFGCQDYSEVQLDSSSSQMPVCLPKRATKLAEYLYTQQWTSNCGSCSGSATAAYSYSTAQTYYKLEVFLNVRFYSTTAARTLTLALLDSNNSVIVSTPITVDLSPELAAFNDVDASCGSCRYAQRIVTATLLTSGGHYPTNLTLTDPNANIQVQETLIQHHICQVQHCSTCASAVECSACLEPYYLQLTSCLLACDPGFYLYSRTCYLACPSGTYTLSSAYSCSSCLSPCSTCANATACLSCLTGYFLEGTQCLSACSSLYLFGNATSLACESCPNPCLTCQLSSSNSSLVLCLSCEAGYLLSSGSCIYLCPWGTFGTYLNGTSQCSPCAPGCAACYINSTSCTACTLNYLLVGTTCTLTNACPQNYYSTSLNRCLPCHYPCKTCQYAATNCSSCVRGTLSNYQCVGTCPTYYYPDYSNSSNATCQPCLSPCLACLSASSCLSCPNGTFLTASTCSSSCPAGEYPLAANSSCVGCAPPCKTCTSSSSCLSCASGYLDGSACVLQCNSSSYADQSFSCKLCVTPCSKCYSATSCLGCDSPWLLFGGTCISEFQCSSKAGYYSSATGSICAACGFPCLTCANNSVTCLACLPGYLLANQMHRCFASCPTHYFQANATCQSCSSSCYQCSQAPDNCTACAGTLYLYLGQCLQSCPQGYYGEESSGQCVGCLAPCQYCYSAYLCSSCATGMLYAKGCVSACPNMTFLNSSANECQACTNNCLTCANASSTCLSCPSGSYLSSWQCVLSCPSGYYGSDYSRSCEACLSPCLACSASTTCLSCIAAYFISSGQCLSACPTSYYTDFNSSSCQLCNATICLACSLEANNCTACNAGYFMANGTCGSSCSDGYYPNSISGTCDGCPFPCTSCLNYSYCSACTDNYYLFYNRCFSRCPTGYFPDNSTCSPCPLHCQSCTASACLQCQSAFWVLNGSCVSSCPVGFFAGSEAVTNYDKCLACQSDCLNCSAYDYCVQCLSSLIQFNGLCLGECPIFYFPLNGSVCSPCSAYCTSCLNASYCLNCIGSFLLGGSCVAKCPSGYYQSGGACKPCLSPCLECSGDYTCTSCLQSYIYFHSYCVSSCPSDVWYYPSNNSCNSACPYNKYTPNMTCFLDRCGTQMVALNGYCLQECSSDYYVDQRQECQPCSDGKGLCSSRFEADLEILYMDVLSLVLYFSQEAEQPALSDITMNIVNIEGSPVEYTLTAHEITPFKLQFDFAHNAVDLVNITLITPYLKSQTTAQCLATNRFRKQLPSYQDYSPYLPPSILKTVPLLLFLAVLLLTIVNIVNKASRFSQVLDYFQLVAVTLYLNIQYPPVLETFLAGFKYSLFAFTENMIAITPYTFSPPKFIYYHTDTSLFRNQLVLLLLFLVVLSAFLAVVAVHTYKHQHCKHLVKVVRYRLINDLFSICLTPLFLFACQFAHANYLFVSAIIIALGLGYVAWISYKIIQVKRMSELSGLLGDFERTESKIGLMYIPFAFVRRMIFTIGLGIAPFQPIASITLLLVLTFLIMVCIYFYQPFDNQYTDYITIFMESSLTLYVVCLIVLGLNVLQPQSSHNMGIFAVALVTTTIAVCLGWLAYLTITDIRTKGWCPELKEEAEEGTVDYSEKKYDQDEEQIRKMEGLQRGGSRKGTKVEAVGKEEDKLKEESANELINRFGLGSAASDQLFSRHNDNNDEFRHWSEQSSNKGIAGEGEEARRGELPELLVKVNRNEGEL